jgi:riboflavin biosynthesis pyrimidine reductase
MINPSPSDDWPDLWSDMLKANTDAPPKGLRCEATAGWSLTHAAGPHSADLFALYKPLLDARAQHQAHAHAAPWVVAQLGQSLDGFIATATGDSFFVNGESCLLHLHRLRALCDAVLVGAGTVAADNPQLTTRKVLGPQPTRVVIDALARLDGRARVFQDGQAPTLWVCDAQHAPTALQRLQALSDTGNQGANADSGTVPHACEVLAVSGLIDDPATGGYAPQRVIDALAQRGLRLLFVEGGGLTVSRFFAAQALHRLHLAMAPVFIGQGRRGLQVQATDVMADCLRPPARTLGMGDDVLWDLALKPSA